MTLELQKLLENELCEASLAVIREKTDEKLVKLNNGLRTSQSFLNSDNCTISFPNKYNFRGSCRKNLITGKGVLENPHHFKYTGDFKNGLFHGEGVFEFGSFTYTGGFQRGKPEGNGTIKLHEKKLFRGNFHRGKRVFGERTYDGGKFKGKFNSMTQRRSEGLYVWEDSSLVGSFSDGRPQGRCRVVWKPRQATPMTSGEEESFEGEFFRGKRHGLGVLKWKQMVLMTVWQKGSKEGPGLLVAVNGDVLIAQQMFKNNLFCESRKLLMTPQILEGVRKLLTRTRIRESQFRKQITRLLESSYDIGAICPFHLLPFNVDLNSSPLISFLASRGLDVKQELDEMQATIVSQYFELKKIYGAYASFGAPRASKEAMMNRVGLWQFMRDLGLGSGEEPSFEGVSVAHVLSEAEREFNILVLSPNDFLEPVKFSDFLKYLLYLIIMTQEAQENINFVENARCDSEGFLAALLRLFLENTLENLIFFSRGKLADKIKTQDKNTKIMMSVFAKMEEPASLRSIFHLVALLKGDLKDLPFMDSVSFKDVLNAMRAVFPSHFDADGALLQSDRPIDGIEFCSVMEQIILLGLKKKSKT